jgi:cytochrome c oxidase cbb3-type subunit III
MSNEPNKDQDPLLMDHEYDGIREYDNPMPRWWLYIFWGTIIYAVLYLMNVPGIGIGHGRIANYEREVAQAKARYGEAGGGMGSVGEDDIMAILADPNRLAAGKAQFVNTCTPCHKADGGGNIGPNLTDAYWIHGNRPTEILKTVSEGVLEKGMPAWSTVMKPDEIAAVVAYVISLRGTNPPDAKGPQGVNADSLAAASNAE